MGRFLLFTLCIVAMLTTAPVSSWSDEDLDDPNLRVFEGKISAVDIGSSSISVAGAVPAKFIVSGDTEIISEVDMYSEDIGLSGLNVGDYVMVEYVSQDEEGRTFDKVLRISVEHSPKDIESMQE